MLTMIDMIYNLHAGDIHAAEFSDEFIHTIEEVKENPLTNDIEKNYPRCFAFLKNTEKW